MTSTDWRTNRRNALKQSAPSTQAEEVEALEIAAAWTDYGVCCSGCVYMDAARLARALLVTHAELARVHLMLPRCLGEWISGSGGHRKYAGGCKAGGAWDVGLGWVCDEHKTRGDDDAIVIREFIDAIEDENESLTAELARVRAVVDAAREVRATDKVWMGAGAPEYGDLANAAATAHVRLESALTAIDTAATAMRGEKP